MPTTKTFSLYLAKTDVAALDDLLTQAGRDLIGKLVNEKQNPKHRSVAPEFADENALFSFPGSENTPGWVEDLSPTFPLPDDLKSISPCAALIFRTGGRIFAATFSYAHVYIDDAKTEADFGLKVAVNTVGDDKLKSVERANIGAAIRDFAQAAGRRDLRAFGFDEALDLVRKVSGYGDNKFANLVSGSRALRFSKEMEIKDLPDMARKALKISESKSYQNTAFKIIDFLSPVDDKPLVDNLDLELLGIIKAGGDDFEIAMPEIVSTSIAAFRFEGAGNSTFYPELSIDIYRDSLGKNLATLNVEDLKKDRIAAYANNGDEKTAHWSVRQALVGSLTYKNERYALNEGAWYRVDEAFRRSAEEVFLRVFADADPKFTPLRKIAGEKKKAKKPKVSYQSEESYNEEMAKSSGYRLLDQKFIGISEEPGRGMEACDLIDIPGRRFIHVKKSSRQSSILSHFFKQGTNAARMFVRYEPFRQALSKKLSELYGDEVSKEFDASLGGRWTVEFQIADSPRKDGSFDIPFFSKLTLKDSVLDIEAMQMDVAVRFIKLPSAA